MMLSAVLGHEVNIWYFVWSTELPTVRSLSRLDAFGSWGKAETSLRVKKTGFYSDFARRCTLFFVLLGLDGSSLCLPRINEPPRLLKREELVPEQAGRVMAYLAIYYPKKRYLSRIEWTNMSGRRIL